MHATARHDVVCVFTDSESHKGKEQPSTPAVSAARHANGGVPPEPGEDSRSTDPAAHAPGSDTGSPQGGHAAQQSTDSDDPAMMSATASPVTPHERADSSSSSSSSSSHSVSPSMESRQATSSKLPNASHEGDLSGPGSNHAADAATRDEEPAAAAKDPDMASMSAPGPDSESATDHQADPAAAKPKGV